VSSPSAAARLDTGSELPALLSAAPGPESLAWLARFARVAAPMGPRSAWAGLGADVEEPSAPGTIVYRAGLGSNLLDVDGNRYVDLAAGFGSLLLGHGASRVVEAVEHQVRCLSQALGDLHPSESKIRLLERLSERFGGRQAILGQSGADALSAALKTAVLATGRPRVIAFAGAYHGLSYGPLALCGLRESYRAPFAAQLNPSVSFVEYPGDGPALARALAALRTELEQGDVSAVVFEPILGRGGCIVPPPEFASRLAELCRQHGSLLVADEVWTGLGRAGRWLYSAGVEADLVCLGKGLGGGLPISACLGRRELCAAWSRVEEVVHTSTFAGAPLACASALATLATLDGEGLVARSERVGAEFRRALGAAVESSGTELVRDVRGAGLMIGIELQAAEGVAIRLCRELLGRGYIASLGGGLRDTLVLTPALDISERLLESFVTAFADALARVAA
jgi:4-aminobutyrate aminotransferase/(S)-3-amino-2-methylpropionate transaminase